MKEIWKKKKIFVITIALIVGIIGTAATFAIITATAGTVTNTFQAAKVATETVPGTVLLFRRKVRQWTALQPSVRCMILTVMESAGIRARTAGFTTTVRLHRGRTQKIYLMQ